ncbi:MAG: hypothetical protein JWN98_617, partial [Abditibacteriota bacterium]|nr:hypothetical protein [Abditibacteriota bacterium]
MRDPWDENLAILSAENVNFSVETAGLGSRFAAAIIDLTIQGVVLALLSIAYAFLISYLPPLNTWNKWVLGVASGFSGLLIFAVIWGYYLAFEWLWDGQTPGKRWLNLRVMMSNGMPLTPWAALVRNLIRIADFLPVGYGIGALLAIVNPNNRRAGDIVAGTVVAREKHDASHHVLSIAQAADAFLAQAAASPSTSSPAHTTALHAGLANQAQTDQTIAASGEFSNAAPNWAAQPIASSIVSHAQDAMGAAGQSTLGASPALTSAAPTSFA